MPAPDGRDTLIDRYVRNRLGSAERAAFELQLLEDDALFEEVERLQHMAEALRAERAAIPRWWSGPGAALPFLAWLRQPWTMAALLMMGVFLVLNALHGGDPAEAEPAGVVTVSTKTLHAERGNEPEVAVPGRGPHLLQIDVALMPSASFTVTLAPSDAALPDREWIVTPDEYGLLSMVIGAGLRGEYRLDVMSDTGETWTCRLAFSGE